jgi:aspartokinase/homoserine dehydrogenase 1
MDTREVLVVNPTGSNQVDPDYLESEKRLEKWFARQPAETIIATGFIASTAENIPTTLKRDGSDFSAAIIGSLVKAGQVTIWTDVDGVFSADPRKGNLVSTYCLDTYSGNLLPVFFMCYAI